MKDLDTYQKLPNNVGQFWLEIVATGFNNSSNLLRLLPIQLQCWGYFLMHSRAVFKYYSYDQETLSIGWSGKISFQNVRLQR